MTVTFDSVNVKDFNFTKYYSSSVGSGNDRVQKLHRQRHSDCRQCNQQCYFGRFSAWRKIRRTGNTELNNATINGSFSTKDFVAKGKNIYVPEDNRSKVSRIDRTATIANAVEIQLSAPDATTPYQERKLIETTADASNLRFRVLIS